MASTTDEILVKFTTEGGQEVVKTFKDVSDQSDQFHQKVSKAGNALGDLRLKSEARVAGNIGAIAQALTSGANAGDVLAISISKVTESFRGSILFAGAATGGAALYTGVTKIGEAVINLRTEIHNLRTESLIPGDFLGADRVNKDLDITIGRITQLQTIQKQANFLGNLGNLGGGVAGLIPGLGPILQNVGQISGIVGKFTDSQTKEERENARGELTQLADVQGTINDALRESLTGNETLAQLYKIQADSKAAEFSIVERAAKAGLANDQSTQEALTSRRTTTNYLSGIEEKKFSIQQRGLETQAETIDIEKELLAPADENLKILDARIAGVQDLLDHQHNLTDQEREQLILQRGQLEATKERAQFTRNLEQDLAGIELGRVRGGLSSDRAKINSVQRNADQARVFGEKSPEYERAEAGLEDEQFRQWEDYQKNPAAFRQRRINEQFERKRFQYARAHGQLPPEIASRPGGGGIPRDTPQSSGGEAIGQRLGALGDGLAHAMDRNTSAIIKAINDNFQSLAAG